jgi:hypothetical protein
MSPGARGRHTLGCATCRAVRTLIVRASARLVPPTWHRRWEFQATACPRKSVSQGAVNFARSAAAQQPGDTVAPGLHANHWRKPAARRRCFRTQLRGAADGAPVHCLRRRGVPKGLANREQKHRCRPCGTRTGKQEGPRTIKRWINVNACASLKYGDRPPDLGDVSAQTQLRPVPPGAPSCPLEAKMIWSTQ